MRALTGRLLSGVGLAALVSSFAYADTQAIDVTTVGTYPPLTNNGFNYYQPPGDYTFSWNFTLNSAIQVTQLGYYDSALAGTPEPDGFGTHLVTLTDLTTEAQLTSTAVTATSPATGVFNYAPVTPVTLSAGDTYRISGTMTDQYYLVGLNQAAAPTASQINYQFSPQDIFGTDGPAGTYNDFGPNFQFASTCTENVPGRDVIALTGDKCTAAGTYNPTTSTVVLPVPYNGFGFYANGGTITSTGPVTINTTNGDGGHGAWADGAGSLISLGGATAISTSGAASYGAYATGGGQIVSTGALSVTTAGGSSYGLYASGAGSSIVATLGSVSTVGGFANGAVADSGGSLTLSGGRVSTSGANTVALLATGANSQITTNNVSVSTSGGNSTGVQADKGGVITLNGGSVRTTGFNSNGLYATGAGSTITAGPSGGVALTIVTTGVGGNAVLADSGGVVNLGAAGLATTVTTSGYSDATGVYAQSLFATGANSKINATNVNISSVVPVGPQVLADQGATIAFTGGSIATTGRFAVNATSINSSTINLSNATLTATGNGGETIYVANGGTVVGDGLIITSSGGYDSATQTYAGGASNNADPGYTSTAGTLKLSNSSISVTGVGGQGVGTANSGVTTLTNDAFSATGSGGYGVSSNAGGQTTLSGGTVTTAGANSLGVWATGAGSSITTALYNGVGLAISTSGDGATGVQADTDGVVTLNGGTVKTSGDNGAEGLYATGEGSRINATNVAILASGNYSDGFDVENGATISLTGGSVTRTGGQNAFDGGATTGGTVLLNGTTLTANGSGDGGLYINGSTAAVTGANVTINVAGGGGAKGASNSSYLNYVGGGTLKLTNSSITVGAAGGIGVYTANGGATTISGGSITTNGASSPAIYGESQSTTTLTNVQILTTGVNSKGAFITGTGTSFVGSGLTITTSGGVDSSNNKSVGVYAGNGGGDAGGSTGGGKVTLTDSNIATSGYYAFGLATLNGGATSMTGGSIKTAGALADGVYSSSSGATTLSGLSITTTGDGAKGISIHGTGTTLTGANLTISTAGGQDATTGYEAQGVYNGDGPTPLNSGNTGGGVVKLTNSTIATSGAYGYGVDTENGGSSTLTGGSIKTTGFKGDAILDIGGSTVSLFGLSLATTGNSAKGLNVEGAGTVLNGTNLTISTAGIVDPATGYGVEGVYNGSAKNPGAQTSGGGTVTLTDTNVSTSGAGAQGVQTANNGVTNFYGGSIATSGGGAVALLSQSGAAVTVALGPLEAATQISTAGLSATAVVANAGGAISLTGATVKTTGAGSTGLAVNDAGSNLSATNVTVSTAGAVDPATTYHANAIYNGPGQTGTTGGTLTLTNVTASTQGLESAGVLTDTGGVTNVAGGAFSTSGANAAAVAADNGGVLTISGATLKTTGDGSPGLVINGAGGSVTASNLTISTTGGVWTAGNGSHADGIYNGAFGDVSGGGVMKVTDTTVETTGSQGTGLSVGAGGTTTFLGGSVATLGFEAAAANASGGGSLTIGPDAAAKATTLTTSGNGSYAVTTSGGSVITLNGAQITTSGDGSGGLSVLGAGSEIDATNVTVTTKGGYDSVSDQHAYGAYNGPKGTTTTGGVLTLTDSTLSTQGQGMYGVNAGASSTTTLSGVSVSTQGAGAHALYASGGGANVTVGGGSTLFTYGAGSYGAYVAAGAQVELNDGVQVQAAGTGGGGVYATGAGSKATLGGTVNILTGASGGSALYADAGANIALTGATSLTAGGTGMTVSGASVAATGSLSLRATSATSAALVLSGDNATFNGAGGGTIDAAGSIVQFLNGSNQSATFDGYTLNSASGDFAYADPSSSTLNFNNSTANAAGGDLVDATNGSTVTLNANSSTLTGAVATDATSTTNVNLANNSSLTLTRDSTITNLNLNNSALSFSPATTGGFKTLTVTNFTGTNGAVTLNAGLGGATPGADEIVVNGGKASGSTLLTIRPVGALPSSNAGPGVPLVVATNGGTIAPSAFALQGPVLVNGFSYTLQQEGGGEYLVSNATQTPAQGAASLTTLSQNRQTQAITTRVLSSILTGATEQINCSSCSSGFASFGSFALGLHGRWTVNDNFAILAGGSFDSFSSRGVNVNNSLQVALAVRYDAVQLGRNRPFLEAGFAAQPRASVTYSRAYDSALGGGVGVGTTLSRSFAPYGRVGYIWRLSRTDEAAVYGDLTRSWDYTEGYTEGSTAGNPNAATIPSTLDKLNVARVGAQYTHLFGQHIEGNLSGGFAQGFGAAYGTSAALGGLGVDTGSAATSFNWWELGARVSYRFSRTLTGDLFAVGTLGAQPVGDQIHGGLALRLAF